MRGKPAFRVARRGLGLTAGVLAGGVSHMQFWGLALDRHLEFPSAVSAAHMQIWH